MQPLRKSKRQATLGHRRALAMMLVLICLATATVATTAYLVSRDTSAAIGKNVAAAAAARWAATTGLDLSVAILETQKDWRSVPNGKLVSGLVLADALIDVELTDAMTNGPPTNSTSYVNVRVVATVGDVQQEATGIVAVSAASRVANVDLSDFAVFGRDRVELLNDATVMRWPTSPLSQLGRRIHVGTSALGSGEFEVRDDAKLFDAVAFHPASAHPELIRNFSDIEIARMPLPDPIAMPAPPHPGVSEPTTNLLKDLLTALTGTVTLVTDAAYSLLNLSGSSSVATIKDSMLIIKEDLRLTSGAGIIVEGNVKIVVFGSVDLGNDTYIELKPGSQLQLFVRGDLDLYNSYIGERRTANVRDVSGAAKWTNPSAVHIHPIDSATTPEWRFSGNSMVVGSLYGPNVRVRLADDSALYGRVAAARVRLRDASSLYYDPALDRGGGYSDRNSALYDTAGGIKPEVLALASLEDADLEALSSQLDIAVVAFDRRLGQTPPPDDTAPGEPTPRVIDVAFSLVGFGTGVSKWEQSP